jgi:hypothetical protein
MRVNLSGDSFSRLNISWLAALSTLSPASWNRSAPLAFESMTHSSLLFAPSFART